MKKVTQLKLSPSRAEEIIHAVARDSARLKRLVSIPGGEWRQTVTTRQIDLCLREGAVVGEPELDDFKNWQVSIARLSAGVNIHAPCST
jgi:hypothetical protein